MTTRIFKNIGAVLSDTADKKHQAALARTAENRGPAQNPREVYEAACAQLASKFEPDGFSYSRAARRLTKKAGDVLFAISFQTSYNNVAGKHVALRVAANVRSRALKKWRADQPHPIRTDDWIAGGLVHMLVPDISYIAWELAEEPERAVQEAADFLRSIVVPYFEQFLPLERLIDHLDSSWPRELDVGTAVELALSLGKREKAQAALLTYLRDHASVAAQVPAAAAALRADGFPSYRGFGYSTLVAWACEAYGLEWKAT